MCPDKRCPLQRSNTATVPLTCPQCGEIFLPATLQITSCPKTEPRQDYSWMTVILNPVFDRMLG